MNNKAANIIIASRNIKGITQTQMAKELEKELGQTYSLRQYQRLEDGDFPKYKREVVRAVEKVLSISVYDIIYDKDVPHETAKEKSIRKPKIETDPEKEGVTFVDRTAQAGYPKKIIDPMFQSSLKKYLFLVCHIGEKILEFGKWRVIQWSLLLKRATMH